ncbi:hypothetical protein BCR42DRAFT_408435 [Absidia repens]|uniref:Uncharacterized protein n=1 Tax=Absidia repens TaxID=90262 RepID=A0A1X2IPX0_9FUNG|nr:hypothetical protein BCR42DRAFT_408435 [Absidia repens]
MSSRDPRRPDKVVAFHIPPATEEEASDWNGNIAMVTVVFSQAMGGVFLRNKVKALPWVSGYFGLSSLLNGRKSIKSNDSFSGNGALIAVVSLVTYYINVYMSHKRVVEAYDTGAVDEGMMTAL